MIDLNSTSNDKPHIIAKSAFSFLTGTALSRISGLARDISMSFFFGTDPSIAAFFVAFRLANLLRRIFGEGALLNSFIPHFEGYRTSDPKQAFEFFRDIFFSLILTLSILISGIEIILHFTKASDLLSEENKQILNLTMIIIPGVLFICLYSICSGLLQCEKKFFLSGFSPVGFNLVWILSIFFSRNLIPQEAVIILSIGITFAFFVQWLITLTGSLSCVFKILSWKEFLRCRLFSPEISKMLSSLSLGIIGVIAAQINTAIDTIFARSASLEGPAYLNYAIHLQQLPLALFGIGISSALLPPLSRAFKETNLQNYKQLLEFSISLALFIIIPCTVGIFVLGSSTINLIFGRGSFDISSILHTVLCLWGYGLGLIPMVLTLLLAPAFYAKKDYITPMKASLISIGINFILNYFMICVFHLGPESLAITTSFSSICNFLILYKQTTKNTDLKSNHLFYASISKTTLIALASGLITMLIGYYFTNDQTIPIALKKEISYSRNFSAQFIEFIAQFLAFCGSFLVFSMILKTKELRFLFSLIRKNKIKFSPQKE